MSDQIVAARHDAVTAFLDKYGLANTSGERHRARKEALTLARAAHALAMANLYPDGVSCGCWRCDGRPDDGTLHALVGHVDRPTQGDIVAMLEYDALPREEAG